MLVPHYKSIFPEIKTIQDLRNSLGDFDNLFHRPKSAPFYVDFKTQIYTRGRTVPLIRKTLRWFESATAERQPELLFEETMPIPVLNAHWAVPGYRLTVEMDGRSECLTLFTNSKDFTDRTRDAVVGIRFYTRLLEFSRAASDAKISELSVASLLGQRLFQVQLRDLLEGERRFHNPNISESQWTIFANARADCRLERLGTVRRARLLEWSDPNEYGLSVRLEHEGSSRHLNFSLTEQEVEHYANLRL